MYSIEIENGKHWLVDDSGVRLGWVASDWQAEMLCTHMNSSVAKIVDSEEST